MSIPHGCDGSATVKVRVQIPEGVIGVKPMPKPGWTISTVRAPYARSYPFYHGQTLTEGVKEIAWAGRLADDFVDDFVFAGFLADTLPAGETLFFPTYQECEKGEWRWIEVPAPGQDAHALAHPAPGVRLLPAAQKARDAHLQGRPARHRGAVDARDARRRAGRRRLPQGHEYRQPAGPPGRRLAGAGSDRRGARDGHERRDHEDAPPGEGARDRARPDRRAQARRLSPDVPRPARWPQGGPDREGQPSSSRRPARSRSSSASARSAPSPAAAATSIIEQQGGGVFAAVLRPARTPRSPRRRPRCTWRCTSGSRRCRA